MRKQIERFKVKKRFQLRIFFISCYTVDRKESKDVVECILIKDFKIVSFML